MFKRICGGLLALALALQILCLPASAAQAEAAVGQARPGGVYALTFRSDLSQTDLSWEFAYSDSLFGHPSTEYDHTLAKATLGLTLAAANTWASDSYYWAEGDVGRQANLEAAYEAFGFGNLEFHNYDISPNTAGDYVGYSFGQKTITENGEITTIVALMLRGGGYGGEWSSNMHVGGGTAHAGFVAPVEEVFESLRAYLAAARAAGELGRVKLWIGGYSRGGAVANLVAARVAHALPELPQEDVFVYTFSAPMAITAEDDPGLQTDYDNNHTPDGALKETWDASNIFNLVSSGDVVAQVLPEEWGYHRNGNDRFLPATRVEQEAAALTAIGAQIGPRALDHGALATVEDTQGLVEVVRRFCGSKQEFHENYEDALMDMLQCAFTRSEREVREGVILSDGEIVHRLEALTNMGQIPWWTLVRNVGVVSMIARPLLEELGDTIPTQAKQLVIPLLAVGLSYELEWDVVEVLVRYIIQLIAVRGTADQVIEIASCHYPENYIALMEYYTPEQHGLAPYTRR